MNSLTADLASCSEQAAIEGKDCRRIRGIVRFVKNPAILSNMINETMVPTERKSWKRGRRKERRNNTRKNEKTDGVVSSEERGKTTRLR